MNEVAIRADRLSKSYRIDHRAKPAYRTIRESLTSAVRRPVARLHREAQETIWALNDVSFEVKGGEALGIIGRNGAGKSTLLKILSRITSPTSGRAEVYGRLSSLLEVGTGFHPELTGRENIFLNGAILGMRRDEIRKRFDEIVDFAETERFLDTPIKHYSTGMYMRLAFAVAAHLETEILVVDEVLAVGDAAFQAKCLGKMEEVAGQGRTVLFVSHNLAAVTQLCSYALLLDSGAVSMLGPTDDVINRYLRSANQEGHVELRPAGAASEIHGASIEWAELANKDGAVCQDFSVGDEISVAFGLRLGMDRPRVKLALAIRGSDGMPIAHVVDDDSRFSLGTDSSTWRVTVRFRDIRLYPGSYRVTLSVSNAANTEVFDNADDCLTFRIVDGGRLTMRPLPRHSGLVFFTPDWVATASGSEAAPEHSASDRSRAEARRSD